MPFCDFLGGWRVKKAPYEIRGLCYAACEEGPACDSWSRIVNRVCMNMTFVASPRIHCVGCIYADRCVYAPDAAYTHMCLYAVVGAYTRVGAYMHPRVRIRG